jgi:hypothetical protein
MERNLEVGVALSPFQVEALDDMMACLEAQGVLQDRTSVALQP